jgi:antitoxin PrlF
MKDKITTTLTSKGQLTIPKSVRDRLGLKRGDKVEVRVLDEETFIAVPIRARREAKR